MASSWRFRTLGGVGARYSKNTVGRTRPTEDRAGQPQKPAAVCGFPDVAGLGEWSEDEKDEEAYESFEPPLHSTAIYADDAELSGHCGSLGSSSSAAPAEGAERSLNTSEIEEGENEFIKSSAKKPRRKPKPISDDSESCNERDVIVEGTPAERARNPRHDAASSSELSAVSAALGTSKKTGPPSAQSSVEKETLATKSHLKTQKKEMFHGKRKKPRHEAVDSDVSDCARIWCLKGKRSSDIMELDVVLSAFEKTIPEYAQNIESKICKEAINKFHSSLKEQLIKTLTEVQKLKTLKRKNAKMTSDAEKKRQRLIEVQNELLWLEPQLKQLQIKYDELKERKSSLGNAAHFLSNLKQLHRDYSEVRERAPQVKETVSPVFTPHRTSGGGGPWRLVPGFRGERQRRSVTAHPSQWARSASVWARSRQRRSFSCRAEERRRPRRRDGVSPRACIFLGRPQSSAGLQGGCHGRTPATLQRPPSCSCSVQAGSLLFIRKRSRFP